ncbi:MAG: leucine--tRNA ligase [bacterium]|nr:leucine--tRNA ligase [bacterium]
MNERYSPHEIESKWQATWEEDGIYHAKDGDPRHRDEKFYGLIEFPYPSGEGLHVGHPRSYTALDIMMRKKRMEGKNVLYPIGWDAFGLPTENFAIKHKIKPQDATAKNVANFTRQLKSLGFGFDWSREINTTDPAYYKWTQWMFLKFYDAFYDEEQDRARPISEFVGEDPDAHRLAFKAKTEINWCPSCKIGLANEEAQGGVCERCGGPVEKREKEQWMLRITKYADRLLNDLESVDYLERIKSQQTNWIGKSEGAYVDFEIRPPFSARSSASSDNDSVFGTIRVFTTRPDTIDGATFLVMAPEHGMVATWLSEGRITNAKQVQDYQAKAITKSDLDRQREDKGKTGVELKGVQAINPATQEEIPVWIADYVLAGYGTGAIMAVPAYDERDRDFADQFKLPIVETPLRDMAETLSWVENRGIGERATTYRLRDWVFSRQRYWGEPIPLVYCDACGTVPLSISDLPLLLPDVEVYEPTDTGESPLAGMTEWVHTTCPTCKGPAKRETDTMPNWAGSSWYFLRYCDPKNNDAFADAEKLKYWMPVDLYNGGMEHTTLHLLYSRFWYKVLFDLEYIPKSCGSEPYSMRRSHALILGEGGIKMSKSKGNVVNPDDIVNEYGADIFRIYEMFIGPFDQDAPWNTRGIQGVKRFLEKVWRVYTEDETPQSESEECVSLIHKTAQKVGDDIESMDFNTAVSTLMVMTNEMAKQGASLTTREMFCKLLAPFAPHLSEELWSRMGYTDSVHVSAWPKADSSKIHRDTFELVIQVDGKVRDKIMVSSDISEELAKEKALASENVQKFVKNRQPSRIVYVPGRLVSIAI